MRKKAVWIIVVGFLVSPQFCLGSQAQREGGLRIHLPREAVIDDDVIQLGEIGIVRGEELSAAKAEGVSLGRLSVPGQRIVVDRPTILSRLASGGIKASEVVLSGAESVSVKRREKIVTGQQFIEVAEAYLGANQRGQPACTWQPLRTPKDVVVPGIGDDIRLLARRLPSRSTRQVKVEVAILSKGEQIATSEVLFRLKYKCQQAVALVDISAGGVIRPENTKMETVTADYPSEWTGGKLPYGLIAKRPVRAGRVIRAEAVSPERPPIVIKRNKSVLMRVRLPGLVVTSVGQALQDGRVGEYIKVRNTDSQRIIVARVSEDGTLNPVF